MWLRDRILQGPPREMNTAERPTMHLFLDGACTPKDEHGAWSGTSIGGVLCDNDGSFLHFFGEVLSDEITRCWSGGSREQLVYEAKIIPYAVALHVWRSYLEGCCLYVYIDNEASRLAWIAGTADREIVQRMIHHALCLESDLGLLSRGKFDSLMSLHGVRDDVYHDVLLRLSQCGSMVAEVP